ncbi:uncharacterized protein LOC125210706 isoform X2 [Salvia hispanica]|uniref:uncharacterized protein LOC125210706 isoform X2 n=1 Tax=Salvia hispanica TaxID=49212 RepID=UPI002008FEB0|nr:uncharacterized protein LOC125210706 isoform X2 [Salvia hispanica]
MTTIWNGLLIFAFYTLTLFCVAAVQAVPYDYSYTLACTPVPEVPQYDGGIIVNPLFDDGLEGWTSTGGATLEYAKSFDGNSFAIISNTVTLGSDGISQCFNAENDKFYTISAWFQTSVDEATAHIKVITSTANQTANWIEQLRNGGYDGPLGIGLEGHFGVVEPNFAYIRASIDMLHAAALPIWITEFDVPTLLMSWTVTL